MKNYKKTLQNCTFLDADENIIPYDGSPLSWRISVYAIVKKDKKIVLVKNKTEKRYDVPGGGVDLGENLKDALKREALEEAGLKIEIKNLIYTHQDYFYHREEKKFYQTLLLFYSAVPQSNLGTPKDKKMEQPQFVSLDEIEKYPINYIVKKALSSSGTIPL